MINDNFQRGPIPTVPNMWSHKRVDMPKAANSNKINKPIHRKIQIFKYSKKFESINHLENIPRLKSLK